MHFNMAFTIIKLVIQKQKHIPKKKIQVKTRPYKFRNCECQKPEKEHKFKRNSLLELQGQLINEFSKLD